MSKTRGRQAAAFGARPRSDHWSTQDNVNNATVYLEGMENGQGFACSGTLIAVVQNTGYVLTAGHCVAGQVTTVGIGADLNSATGYTVTGQWQHPITIRRRSITTSEWSRSAEPTPAWRSFLRLSRLTRSQPLAQR